MTPFEARYSRRCHSPIRWFKVGETRLFSLDLFYQAKEKVEVIRDRRKTAQVRQKSYVNVM